MNPSLNTEEIKNRIVDNQQLIDKLNADLVRKTQEVRIIQEISTEINTTLDLDTILSKMLLSLDKTFEFKHSMVLLVDTNGETLKVAASHGYSDSGIGAEVKIGEGIIGVVAKRKKLMRMGNIGTQMAYLNSVKTQFAAAGKEMQANIKLPGLPNVQSQVAIPLLSESRLVGVLAVESSRSNVFDNRDEMIITILANQAASAIEKAKAHEELKRINEHLEDLVTFRTKEVVSQKEIIEEKNKNIMDSIRYAKRIQDALLPGKNYLDNNLKEYFVLFKPKDVVSGDFYWVNAKDNKVFFTAIDCTGHGVPGAFVSIVAHGNLQRSLIFFGLKTPAEILDKVNEGVVEMFTKESNITDPDSGAPLENSIKDGMDMALCALDRQNMKLEFSGANNPMYLVRQGTLTEIKGDKQPVGHYTYRKNFTNHVIDVVKGDVIYLFSDGYADQFGGPKEKKFKYAPLKELFASICQKPMDEQKEILNKVFEEWKGMGEQTDDICLMGVRV